VLALGALGTVIGIGISLGDTRALIALSIYGLSQLASYIVSTLYHALRISPSGMELLLRLDCVLVFVFIAGTYTPVCLIALQAGWRWGLLGLVWGIAVGGLVLKLLWLHGVLADKYNRAHAPGHCTLGHCTFSLMRNRATVRKRWDAGVQETPSCPA
jgi:channel protein (hemolysin III family)